MRRSILKVTVTTAAGREITVEGPGSVTLVTSKTDGVPVARLEVTMPVAATLESGEGGKYVKAAVAL